MPTLRYEAGLLLQQPLVARAYCIAHTSLNAVINKYFPLFKPGNFLTGI